MACFTVPLASAAIVAAAERALNGQSQGGIFSPRLHWLGKMMFGGSFLLAIEHLYHGEITLVPPFLTAVEEGPEAIGQMLHEMATRGVAMTLLVVAAWAAMALFSHFSASDASSRRETCGVAL